MKLEEAIKDYISKEPVLNEFKVMYRHQIMKQYKINYAEFNDSYKLIKNSFIVAKE